MREELERVRPFHLSFSVLPGSPFTASMSAATSIGSSSSLSRAVNYLSRFPIAGLVRVLEGLATGSTCEGP